MHDQLQVGALDAFVLCGGLGTRLRDAVGELPKALAPVAGKPFISYLLSYLAQQGVRRVVLGIGHGAEQVQDFCGDGASWGIGIAYSREVAPLGTGGALVNALPLLASTPFLVLNGDSMAWAELQGMIDTHVTSGASATISLVQVDDVSRFGGVEIDASGQVTRFGEKSGSGPGLINAGIYVVEREALVPNLRPGPSSLERDLFPVLARESLFGFVTEGPFIDIGTPESYALAPAVLSNWFGASA